MMDAADELAQKIEELVAGDGPLLVDRYLADPDCFVGRPRCYGFGGAEFTRLGRDPALGYVDPAPYRWLMADALALTMLDERVTPAALRMLREDAEDRFATLLAGISPTLDLWDATSDDLEAAKQSWSQLKGLPGIGRVRASKLMARKRPRLVPVQDSVIDGFSGHPDRTEYWELLGRVLRDGGLRSRVDALRPDGFKDISTIRCLDIAIWMSGSRSTQAKHAQDPSS